MNYPVNATPTVLIDHEALSQMVSKCSEAGVRALLVGYGEYAKHLINLCRDNVIAVCDPDEWKQGITFRGVPVVPLGSAPDPNLIIGCEYRLLYDYLGQVKAAYPDIAVYFPNRLDYKDTTEIKVFEQETIYKNLFKDLEAAPVSMMALEKIKFLLELLRLGLTFPGHVVEMGSWQGGSLWYMAKTLEALGERRNLYGMDLFETHPIDHTATMSSDEIARRLAFYPGAKMITGLVDDPNCLAQVEPGPICFAHVDLGPIPKALEFLWDRLAVGAPLVLDNYGHLAAPPWEFEAFFAARGTRVTRLPWSEQGLVFKR